MGSGTRIHIIAPSTSAPSLPPSKVDESSTKLIDPRITVDANGSAVSVGRTAQNVADGGNSSISLTTLFTSKSDSLQFGPTYRTGGLSLGLLSGGSRPSLQLGLGGITITSQAEITSGLLAIGSDGVRLISPEMIPVIAVLSALNALGSTDREDIHGLPLSVLSGAIELLLPTEGLRSAASSLGISTGRGPKAKTITTQSDLKEYISAIDQLITGSGWTDAKESLIQMLELPQDPYVRSLLSSRLDSAIFQNNARGILEDESIADNIDSAIRVVSTFERKFERWLSVGEGEVSPEKAEIDSYLASILYLSDKQEMRFEQIDEDGRSTLKINSSAPVQFNGAESAVEMMEILSRAYNYLADPRSGLSKHLSSSLNSLSQEFTESMTEQPFEIGDLKARYASAHWQWQMINSIAMRYSSGDFHRRLRYTEALTRDENSAEKIAELKARLRRIEYPSIAAVVSAAASIRQGYLPAFTNSDVIDQAMMSMDTVIALGSKGFQFDLANYIGKGDVARRQVRGDEIVDAFFHHAVLFSSLQGSIPGSPDNIAASRLVTEDVILLRSIVKSNPTQVRRELGKYRDGGELATWHSHLLNRIDELRSELESISASDLTISDAGISGSVDVEIKRCVLNIKERASTLTEAMDEIQRRISAFKDLEFDSIDDLLMNARMDSMVIIELNEQLAAVISSIETYRGLLKKAHPTQTDSDDYDDGEIDDLIIDDMDVLLSTKIAAIMITSMQINDDFEFYNRKRIGIHLLNRALVGTRRSR